MNLKLEPYQSEIVDFLLSNDRAYCNVGVGLGKTAATLSALNTLFAEGAIRAALVVAPLRVARMTWPNELEKWDQFKWMKYEVLRGQKPSGNAQIYLVNWERIDKLEDLDFCDAVVFDETTRAKSPKSVRVKKFMPLLKHHLRWGLTGTPRPNSLLELFGQVKLLDDGARLGKSYYGFKESYFYPTDYMRYNWVPRPGAEEKIYQKLSDLTLTMRSSDYLKIPETLVEDVEIVLPHNCPARRIYRDLEKEFIAAINNTEVVARNAAVLVGKLLQVSGGAIYDEAGKVHEIHQNKLDTLELIRDAAAEPLLVACNFIHERERICARFPDAVDASKFKGDIEKEWNSGKVPMLVTDPRSLGHGLNLQQGGRNTVWFSLTWSRELYDQFNARVARKGQDKETRIYRIICNDTIDEAVAEALRVKGSEQEAMMQVMTNYRKLLAAR